MPDQKRRIVYFLGAGASYGAGATARVEGGGKIPIPTQGTFWDTFIRFSRGIKNRHIIENFLFQYFLDYARAPSRLSSAKRREKVSGIDVEEVFTFLSERINAPETLPQLKASLSRVWNALLAEFCSVFSRFPPNSTTRSVYRKFLHNHIRSRDTVVSFNYDTVFENSLPSSVSWYYSGIQSEHKSGALRIVKPHGSINWDATESGVRVRSSPLRPIIVAPTHLKFVGAFNGNENEKIGYINKSASKVWAEMEKQMRAAKALVFIGYSFPIADLYFASVLRSVLAARDTDPFLVIVNPQAMALKERMQTRFAVKHIATYFDLDTFVQVSRSDILGMLKSAG